MRYHQPYGINDPDAPYINGDPSIARQGSIIPAEAVEFPQREIIAAIEGAKMVSDDADLAQLLLAMRSQRMNYAVAIGGGVVPANTVAVEFDPPIGNSMTPGMLVRSEHPLLWTFANTSSRIVNETEWQTPANRMWAAFSRGDGSTTFRLPDFRAEFLRFWDDGRGADSGRLLTIQQKDAVGEFSITANVTIHNLIANPESGYIPGPGFPVMWFQTNSFTSTEAGGDNPAWGVTGAQVTSLSGAASINGNTGLETRTRNTVVTACIVDG